MDKLPQNIASSIRSLAQSMLNDKINMAKQQKKIDAEIAKYTEMESNVSETDTIIKKKSGGFGFDDLFDIRVVENEGKDGKISKSNKLFWKFPETYIPSQPEEIETEKQEQEQEQEQEVVNDNTGFINF